MKFNDMLNEEQITELGILKNIQRGMQNAVSGYKANKAQRQGQEHSSKIVDILKAEFMQQVGGGGEATYQNLIDFLTQQGFDNLNSIPDPTKTSAPTTAPTANKSVDTGHPADDNTNIQLGANESLSEAAVGVLNNMQIDAIIKSAVQKNYSRIRSAQTGGSGGANLPGDSTPSASASTPSSANVFSDPVKLAGEWASYIASGGQINKKLRRLITTMNQSLTTAPAKKPAPAAKPAANKAPTPAVDVGHPADDNANVNLGANESVFYSKFLGKSL